MNTDLDVDPVDLDAVVDAMDHYRRHPGGVDDLAALRVRMRYAEKSWWHRLIHWPGPPGWCHHHPTDGPISR